MAHVYTTKDAYMAKEIVVVEEKARAKELEGRHWRDSSPEARHAGKMGIVTMIVQSSVDPAGTVELRVGVPGNRRGAGRNGHGMLDLSYWNNHDSLACVGNVEGALNGDFAVTREVAEQIQGYFTADGDMSPPSDINLRKMRITHDAAAAARGAMMAAVAGGGSIFATAGGAMIMFHGTDASAARSIEQGGFRPSTGGMLGRGVYVSRDVEKAKAYGSVVLRVSVRGWGSITRAIRSRRAGTRRGTTRRGCLRPAAWCRQGWRRIAYTTPPASLCSAGRRPACGMRKMASMQFPTPVDHNIGLLERS